MRILVSSGARMGAVALSLSALALGCSAPRKTTIPVDSSLKTWEAPEVEAPEVSEPAAPAVAPAAAAEPAAPAQPASK